MLGRLIGNIFEKAVELGLFFVVFKGLTLGVGLLEIKASETAILAIAVLVILVFAEKFKISVTPKKQKKAKQPNNTKQE